MTSNFLKDKINEMHERIGKNKYRRETPDGVILGDPSAKNGVTFNLSDNFINAESYIKPSKNKDCEYKFKFRNDAECCRLMPISDPESKELLGFLACDVIPDEYCKILRNLKTKNEESLGKINAETKVPHPLMLDEVSASFISYIRTNFWEKLGKEYGGYKIGRILSFILCVLNEKIEDSTAATIKVDVPQYEQLNKVSCNCGGDCKCHKEEPDEERFCLHCKESDGTINHDVFTKIFDEDLGFGWICKECFLQSCKETEELLKEKCEEVEQLEKQISFKDKCLKHIENMAKDPIDYFPDKSKMEALIKTRKESYIKAAQNGLEGLYNVNKN